jgi:chaperone modulatory protein CbpM
MTGNNNDALRGVLLNTETVFSVREFCRACGVERSLLLTMLDEGVIEPLPNRSDLEFHGEALIRARRALRLVDDLGVNWPGAALALDLLDELDLLQVRLGRRLR